MPEAEGRTVMLDDTFDALASRQRRRVIVSLLDHNPQPDQLEGAIAEADGENERIRAAMYHNHLPKLEARGFIRWDRNTHRIEKGPAFGQIRPLVELLDSHASELPGAWP